jgi:hypothetical protein
MDNLPSDKRCCDQSLEVRGVTVAGEYRYFYFLLLEPTKNQANCIKSQIWE